MPMNVIHDANGLPRVLLTEPMGSSAEVLLYGGQVVSWKNDRREELLFMSSKAICKPPKAVRGGIPICFPQFGNFGSLERHGLARNRMWSLDTSPAPFSPATNQSTVDLILKSSEDELKIWPQSFELRLRISLSPGKLTLIPRVRNTDHKSLSFMFALRNYLSISDIRLTYSSIGENNGRGLHLDLEWIMLENHAHVNMKSEVRIEGLETLDYLDNLINRERFTEQADAITFDGEVDRVYLKTPSKIAIIDHEKKRTFVLRKDGLPDAAVWNPWDKKTRAIPDLGDEDYKSMLCMDSAAVESQIVLKPSEEWKGYQEISTVSSSYCSGQLDPRKVLYGFA